MEEKLCEKTSFVYLLITVFCAVFGAIYEMFSHGVYSYYMIYAFLFPLAGGAVLWSIIGRFSKKRVPCAAFRNLYHSGIAALTIGSIFKGIIEIYGTQSDFDCVYMIAGVGLVILSFVFLLIDMARHRNKR